MYKNRLLITVLLFAVSLTSHAQEKTPGLFDTAVEAYVKELRTKKIDTILLFRNVLPVKASTVAATDCSQPEPAGTYVLWLKSGRSYITKMDACYTYSVKEVGISMLWNYIRQNAKALQKEQPKPFQYYQKDKDGVDVLTTLVPKMPYGSHYARLVLKKQSTDIRLQDVDLLASQKLRRVDYSNIHYAENTALKANGLFETLLSVVYPLESSNLIERTKKIA